MPGIDGASFVREARKPDLAFRPFITGYTNLVQGPGAELPRLAKPFRQAELASRIAELVETARSRDNVIRLQVQGALVRTRANSKFPTFRNTKESACPKTAL